MPVGRGGESPNCTRSNGRVGLPSERTSIWARIGVVVSYHDVKVGVEVRGSWFLESRGFCFSEGERYLCLVLQKDCSCRNGSTVLAVAPSRDCAMKDIAKH